MDPFAYSRLRTGNEASSTFGGTGQDGNALRNPYASPFGGSGHAGAALRNPYVLDSDRAGGISSTGSTSPAATTAAATIDARIQSTDDDAVVSRQ